MTKEIVVQSFYPLKNGETNGKKWTLWGLVGDDRITYSTFDSSFKNFINKKVQIDYEVQTSIGANGKEFVSYRITSKAPNQNPVFPLLEEINKKIDIILKKLEQKEVVQEVVTEKEQGDIFPEEESAWV